MRLELKVVTIVLLVTFASTLWATDWDKKQKSVQPEKNGQVVKDLVETMKKEGYILLNVHRDSYTFVIPASNNISGIMKNLENNQVLTSEQMDDFYLLWNKVKNNDGIGILEHEPITKNSSEIGQQSDFMLPEQHFTNPDKSIDPKYNYLGSKAKLLKEVVQYHEQIKKAKQDLEELRKEKDVIKKRLDFLKEKLTGNQGNSALSNK